MTSERDGWRPWFLADVAEYVNGRPTKPSEVSAAGVPVIKIAELSRGITASSDRIPQESVSPKHWVNEGDLLFAWSGSVGIHVYSGPRAALNQHIFRVVARAGIDQRFLRYLLIAQMPTFSSFVADKQTTMGHVTMADLRATEVEIPPLPEQRAIAAVLGSLDDKIDLNRRMNATLEATARAIFKAWFVDFEALPVEAGRREPVAMVAERAARYGDPNGWKAGEIGDIADVVDCLHSKKPERQEAGRPLLQLSNIVDYGLLDVGDSYWISEADYRAWTTKFEAQGGDCVITNVGRVGAVAQVPEGYRAALGRNMTGLRCRADFPFPTFLVECLRSEAMKEEIERRTDTGTILNALNVRNIPRLAVRVPPVRLAERFERDVRPLRRQMELNLEESRTLAALRDTLLSKLLSGEIRVKDIA